MSRPQPALPTSAVAPVAVYCPPGRDTLRWLADRHAHHLHVVTVNPAACLRLEIHEAAEAALDNMGHDASLTAGVRPAEALAAAWLHARGVTDVLFVDCQIHPPDRVRRILDWFTSLGIRTWLCITRAEPNDLAAAALEKLTGDAGGHTVRYALLERHFPDRRKENNSPETTLNLPDVPMVDVLAFRQACRDLLLPDDFVKVDELFIATVARIDGKLRLSTDRQRTRAAQKIFRRALERTGDTNDFIVTVRAIQAAALRNGFNVRVAVPMLLGGEATVPRIGKLDAQNAWLGLARYRDPDVGAVAALYHHGIDPELMPELTITDVFFDTAGDATVATSEGVGSVSGPGALFLRALVRYRQLTASGTSALLFHTHRQTRVRPAHISTLLTVPAQEVGTRLCSKPLRQRHLDDELWLTRHGIDVALIRRRDAKDLKAGASAP
jgi:hypothetical protein